jgi:leucyl-tRNA synthetase
MDEKYHPEKIEAKWQRHWGEKKLFQAKEDPTKEKYYLLEMYPYPSGAIHMGHMRNYSIGDVVARYKMMRGYNVLHPMGWDAFGMPAENAAIESGVHPAKWTYENIDTMRRQLKRMGFSYDWEREVATCDVEYYKWEQWFFLKMCERGLAYKKRSLVNWCPSCQTVLANEQVEGGLCWRCESEVTEKELDQWFLKITDYAEDLLEYCDKLPGWPERVLRMQRNWIGKSEGAEIRFPLENSKEAIPVFTTRQDTVFGATFMSLAPEHPLTLELSKGTSQEGEVREFVERVKRQSIIGRTGEDTEKEGVFVGANCLNPMTGARMPIFAANFVLMEYGTGAVMAVPTHDQRDFEFAKRYGLPLIVVIQPPDSPLSEETMTEAYVDEGTLVNSGQFNGMDSVAAREAIVKYLEENGLGGREVNYRIQDWGISRQRYWGAPIPIIYCDRCGIQPVPEEDLPVVLPHDVEFTGKGGSPLAECRDFVETQCPKCGGDARRETDTMDTFVESSWYFDRFASPRYNGGPLDKEKVDYWMPVDQYIGGIEHAILHLLYSRFFARVLKEFGLVRDKEPFTRLLTQGMVIKDGAKMSKSRGNVVDPEYLVSKYGADTARIFCLFASPPEKDLEWSDQGVEGSFRFLNRVWRLVYENHHWIKETKPNTGTTPIDHDLRVLRQKVHKTIKKVGEDIERFHFNTAISAIMELVNALYQFKPTENGDPAERLVFGEALEAVTLLLSPFVPHIAEELWEALGKGESIIKTPWPDYDREAIVEEKVLVVIQVNGKVRDRVTVPFSMEEEEIKGVALEREKIRRLLHDKAVQRIILVPKKLINIVCA